MAFPTFIRSGVFGKNVRLVPIGKKTISPITDGNFFASAGRLPEDARFRGWRGKVIGSVTGTGEIGLMKQ